MVWEDGGGNAPSYPIHPNYSFMNFNQLTEPTMAALEIQFDTPLAVRSFLYFLALNDLKIDKKTHSRMRGNSDFWRDIIPFMDDEVLIQQTKHCLDNCAPPNRVTYDEALQKDYVPELLKRLTQAKGIAASQQNTWIPAFKIQIRSAKPSNDSPTLKIGKLANGFTHESWSPNADDYATAHTLKSHIGTAPAHWSEIVKALRVHGLEIREITRKEETQCSRAS